MKIGDKILVEQAWEDDNGHFHDEYAEVVSIGINGELGLEFQNEEINEFLAGAEYNIKDFE